MINTTLSKSFANLKAALPNIGDATPLDATVAPFLDFDSLTNRAVLYDDQMFLRRDLVRAIWGAENHYIIERKALRSTQWTAVRVCV